MKEILPMEMEDFQRITTVTYGSKTIRFRGPQVWVTVPQFIKDPTSLTEFKSKIKS